MCSSHDAAVPSRALSMADCRKDSWAETSSLGGDGYFVHSSVEFSPAPATPGLSAIFVELAVGNFSCRKIL